MAWVRLLVTLSACAWAILPSRSLADTLAFSAPAYQEGPLQGQSGWRYHPLVQKSNASDFRIRGASLSCSTYQLTEYVRTMSPAQGSSGGPFEVRFRLRSFGDSAKLCLGPADSLTKNHNNWSHFRARVCTDGSGQSFYSKGQNFVPNTAWPQRKEGVWYYLRLRISLAQNRYSLWIDTLPSRSTERLLVLDSATSGSGPLSRLLVKADYGKGLVEIDDLEWGDTLAGASPPPPPPLVLIQSPSKDTTVLSDTLRVFYTVNGASRSRLFALLEGANTLIVDTLDTWGRRGADTVRVTFTAPQNPYPRWPSNSIIILSNPTHSTLTLSWPSALHPSGILRYKVFRDGIAFDSVPGQSLSYTAVGLLQGRDYRFRIEAVSGLGQASFSGPEALGAVTGILPPEPETLAPEVPDNRPTSLFDAVSFLGEGAGAIQAALKPQALDSERVAILRGRVLGPDLAPLSAVTVSLKGERDLGSTVTRSRGEFDLLVNGGRSYTLQFEKRGYLPAERRLAPGWERFAMGEDVILIPLDTQKTLIAPSSSQMQVAKGSVVSDEAGVRQQSLLFQPGTEATALFADGITRPLSSLTVRSTEYTVGPQGQKRMPAPLPAPTAYTYAAEFSVDEAQGARSVNFSKPVITHLDNFLDYPVGIAIPSGYYCRKGGSWVPSEDGVVLKVVGHQAGKAILSDREDGTPLPQGRADSMGITSDELLTLAAKPQGYSFWRVAVDHFTAWDFNVLMDSTTRDSLKMLAEKCKQKQAGTIIHCEDRVLEEKLDLPGTPISLHYLSFGQRGHRKSRTLEAYLPQALRQRENVKLIRAYFEVEGRDSLIVYRPPFPEILQYRWDGKNRYGQSVYGPVPGKVRLELGSLNPSIASRWRAGVASFGNPLSVGTPIPLPQRDTLWVRTEVNQTLYGERDEAYNLGGWLPDMAMDLQGRAEELGRFEEADLRPEAEKMVLTTYAGNGTRGDAGDGGQALDASIDPFPHLVSLPDGSLIFAHYGREHNTLRRIDRNGTISTIAGGGIKFLKDGLRALEVSLNEGIRALKASPSGDIYFATPHQIFRLKDGKVEEVATFLPSDLRRLIYEGVAPLEGTGPYSPTNSLIGALFDFNVNNGNGLYDINSLAFDREGNLFIGIRFITRAAFFSSNPRFFTTSHLFKASACGKLHWIAGGYADEDYLVPEGGQGPFNRSPGVWPFYGFGEISHLQVTDEGRLQFIETAISYAFSTAWYGAGTIHKSRMVEIDEKGRTKFLLNTGGAWGDSPDGTPLRDAKYTFVSGMSRGPQGEIIYADYGNRKIKRLNTLSGKIETLAGNGLDFSGSVLRGSSSSPVGRIRALTHGVDGSLFFIAWDAAFTAPRIMRLGKAEAGETVEGFESVTADGLTLQRYGKEGRLSEEVHTETGITETRYGYDATGRIAFEEDKHGNRSRFIRDGEGKVLRIEGPYGQATDLEYNSEGYLSEVRNALGEAYRMEYYPGGLLKRFINPKGYASSFTYDEMGNLISDENAMGDVKTLSQARGDSTITTTFSNSLGHTTRYETVFKNDGSQLKTIGHPFGLVDSIITLGVGTVIFRNHTGVSAVRTPVPDPRFGGEVLEYDEVITLPSGLTRTLKKRSTVEGLSGNSLGFSRKTETLDINGRFHRSEFLPGSLTRIRTTPEGRQSRIRLNENGQMTFLAMQGLDSLLFEYDERGRLILQTQGEGESKRERRFAYGSDGRVRESLDALGDTVEMGYDAIGRLVRQSLSGSDTLKMEYDANGNLISISPPGKPAHRFSHTPMDWVLRYSPPSLGAGVWDTEYDFTLDGQIERQLNPDGVETEITYDGGGRMSRLRTPEGEYRYQYDGQGQLIEIQKPGMDRVTFTYDGPLLTEEVWSGVVGGSVRYEYDENYWLRGMDVAGKYFDFAYDGDGLMTRSGSLAYDWSPSNGLLLGTTFGQVSDRISYNSFGERSGYEASASLSPNSLFKVDYHRDKLGRIIEVSEVFLGDSTHKRYTYDRRGRLATITEDGAFKARYSYDANGNRLEALYPGRADLGLYDAQDRLLSYGGIQYRYNRNGDLTEKQEGNSISRYQYNALGNLKWAELPDGRVVEYLIDPKGRRIGKKVDGQVVSKYLYSGQLRIVAPPSQVKMSGWITRFT